jgi:hypothetical protein
MKNPEGAVLMDDDDSSRRAISRSRAPGRRLKPREVKSGLIRRYVLSASVSASSRQSGEIAGFQSLSRIFCAQQRLGCRRLAEIGR